MKLVASAKKIIAARLQTSDVNAMPSSANSKQASYVSGLGVAPALHSPEKGAKWLDGMLLRLKLSPVFGT